ncbi:MAG: hypothetical protein ACE5EO_10005 [Candidatus Krumholzibacteriia bacterium]
MTAPSDFPPLDLYRCGAGHAFFSRHATCPVCTRAVAPFTDSARATLVGQTTVRVNPGGEPFRLGLAAVACGAQTLCIIDAAVGDGDGQHVMLREENGLYHASDGAGSAAETSE